MAAELKEGIMLASGVSTSPQVAEGPIQVVDLVSRTVAVLLHQEGFLIFDVPPDCEVRLNGERVKLRLLQPGDRVQIVFCRKRGILAARSLNVTTRQPAMTQEGK